MTFKMLGTKWCEALFSDFSVRGAFRVVLDRGGKFGIFRHSSDAKHSSAVFGAGEPFGQNREL